MSSPSNVPLTLARANRLSRREPCSTACSPLLMAISKTAMLKATNPHIWSCVPKVTWLNNGDNNKVSKAPPSPSHNDHRRTTTIMREMRVRSSPATACEISRTLLPRIPKLVPVLIISSALLKRPKSPTPTGPIQMATSLVRMMEQRMPITCTPPKSPIAFMANRDMLVSFFNSWQEALEELD